MKKKIVATAEKEAAKKMSDGRYPVGRLKKLISYAFGCFFTVNSCLRFVLIRRIFQVSRSNVNLFD
jgi:hypothetical protein